MIYNVDSTVYSTLNQTTYKKNFTKFISCAYSAFE